jgi:hypothetical protein
MKTTQKLLFLFLLYPLSDQAQIEQDLSKAGIAKRWIMYNETFTDSIMQKSLLY